MKSPRHVSLHPSVIAFQLQQATFWPQASPSKSTNAINVAASVVASTAAPTIATRIGEALGARGQLGPLVRQSVVNSAKVG